MNDETRTQPMAGIVRSHTSKGVNHVGIRRQAWQHVTCAPTCPNAGPWTIYGPVGDVERYLCARCGRPMTVTELLAKDNPT